MANNPYELREIFERITFDLIRSLRKTFVRHRREELKEGFQWEQWQLVKLREIQKYRNENQNILGKYSPEIESGIQKILDTSFALGEKRVQRDIEKAFQIVGGQIDIPRDTLDPSVIQKWDPNDVAALLDPDTIIEEASKLPMVPREDSFFGMNEKKLDALKESVTNDMEKAQHAVLRQMDDVYRQTVYKAQIHMTSGAKTIDQAIDMATKEFLEKGINCIEYKDGKRVNVASYAEMLLRTTSHRATLLGEGKKRSEWGIYTVVVTAHANSCDLCIPWQGKVLIDDIFSRLTREQAEELSKDLKHPLLSKAVSEGLLHPNCRHTMTTYFPEITQLPEIPDDETARVNYEAEQKQRHMELQVRRWKRRSNGSLDEENVKQANKKVAKWQGSIRAHLEEFPHLRRNYSRERTRGIS